MTIRALKAFLLLSFVVLCGCGQLVADSIFHDQYAKQTTVSRTIKAASADAALKASVAAAGDTGWTPKVISPETNYMLAELVPDAFMARGARDYTNRLEVRLPEKGVGIVTVVFTPPQGVITKPTPDEYAKLYLDALDAQLAKRAR